MDPTVPYVERSDIPDGPPVLEMSAPIDTTADMDPTMPYVEHSDIPDGPPVLEMSAPIDTTADMDPTMPYVEHSDIPDGPPVLEMSAPIDTTPEPAFHDTEDAMPFLERSDVPIATYSADDTPPELEASTLPANSTCIRLVEDPYRNFGLSPVRFDTTFVVERRADTPTEFTENRPDPSLNESFDLTYRTPDDPEPIVERSLDEAPLTDTIIADESTTYEIVEQGTIRRCRKLVSSDGYSFTVKSSNKKTTQWRCAIRNRTTWCRAIVIQRGDTFTPGTVDHIHPPDHMVAKTTKLKKQIYDQAVEEVFTSAGNIVEGQLQDHLDDDDFDLPKPTNLVRFANRCRQKIRPTEPTDLNFTIDTDFLKCDGFLRGDIRVDTHRHLLFATANQLTLLQQARRWYIDGTFKIRREPFTQMWSIHAFLQRDGCMKQVPLCFVLMSRRTTADYEAAAKTEQVLRHLLTCFERPPVVAGFMMDFETACWRAVQAVFPDAELKGCSFHWAQAVLRKVDDLGLRTTYRKRQGVAEYIRKLMALPFLPHNQIEDSFLRLRRLANTPELQSLVEYLDRQWIRSTVFSPESWCVFRQSIRTNNDVEGWHRRINGKARRTNLPFYMLVPLLHQEGRLVDLQQRLVSEQVLSRHQTSTYRRIQGRISELWDSYTDKKITTSVFLKTVGKVYCPALSRATDE